jgi:hypothetical protein
VGGNWLTLLFLSAAAMSVSAAQSVPACAIAIPLLSVRHALTNTYGPQRLLSKELPQVLTGGQNLNRLEEAK